MSPLNDVLLIHLLSRTVYEVKEIEKDPAFFRLISAGRLTRLSLCATQRLMRKWAVCPANNCNGPPARKKNRFKTGLPPTHPIHTELLTYSTFSWIARTHCFDAYCYMKLVFALRTSISSGWGLGVGGWPDMIREGVLPLWRGLSKQGAVMAGSLVTF